MSAKKLSDNFKTWVEIDSRAVHGNLTTFRKIVGSQVKILAVVKSNAYGHGLFAFSKLADKFGADGFCVDSVVEGVKLREGGVKKDILVLGPTLFNRLEEAAADGISVGISNFDSLKFFSRSKVRPQFHLKIDTGMHRQGFYIEDIPKVIRKISSSKNLKGIFSHFASAKDVNYPTYTENQFRKFKEARRMFEKAGYKNLLYHAAATGGTLIDKKYHLDAVRLGIGLYGLWPSRELQVQLSPKILLEPVLSWRTVVTEVKNLKEGDYVGYDLSERVFRPSKAAVLPIGYWHGYPRSLSSAGHVLVNGRRAKVLGRVSMDLVVADVTGIPCRVGDFATLIGRSGREEILAGDIAQTAGTVHYEFLTRLNPLMERAVT